MANIEDNKRIVKNTLLLYIRQFFTLGLSLYTSRLTLNVLGVTDFGIYAAVGGITALLSILTSSMSTTTQRFMTFELGKKDNEKLNRVYITSIQIYILFSVLLFILGETIGLWFISNKLTIPAERLEIAIYVFHFSLLICILNVLNIPNQAAIIAHEDMGTFALFSITDATFKLVSVLILFWISWDKLLIYAVFLFLIQLINRIASIVYCHYNYTFIKYRNIFDKSLAKEMFSLAGWNIVSNISVMGFIQGVNILLNIFFGPILNAAYTVAMQAYSGIRSFCSSFQLASNPQIIKSYSTGDYERMHSLLITVCKMSFFLIFFLSLPFAINAEAILELWLGKVPKHATAFFILLLLYAYFDVFAYPMDVAAQATGKIKKYNILISLTTLTTLPIGYLLYLSGAIPETIYIVAIIMSIVGLMVRITILSNLILMNKIIFLKQVILRSFGVGLLSSILPLIVSFLIPNTIYRVILTFLLSFLASGSMIYLIGLTSNERKSAIEYFYSFYSQFKK